MAPELVTVNPCPLPKVCKSSAVFPSLSVMLPLPLPESAETTLLVCVNTAPAPLFKLTVNAAVFIEPPEVSTIALASLLAELSAILPPCNAAPKLIAVALTALLLSATAPLTLKPSDNVILELLVKDKAASVCVPVEAVVIAPAFDTARL